MDWTNAPLFCICHHILFRKIYVKCHQILFGGITVHSATSFLFINQLCVEYELFSLIGDSYHYHILKFFWMFEMLQRTASLGKQGQCLYHCKCLQGVTVENSLVFAGIEHKSILTCLYEYLNEKLRYRDLIYIIFKLLA